MALRVSFILFFLGFISACTGSSSSLLPFDFLGVTGGCDETTAETEALDGAEPGYVSREAPFDTKVHYLERQGRALVEGDIDLGDHQELRETQELAEQFLKLEKADGRMSVHARGANSRAWPGGVIPYSFAPEFPAPIMVREQMDVWENALTTLAGHQVVQFVPYNPAVHSYQVIIRHTDSGCYASVGKRYNFDLKSFLTSGNGWNATAVQYVNLGEGCQWPSVVLHELGHTLGLWHEHNRLDRNQYVHVNWCNVQPNERNQFIPQLLDGVDVGPYDYASIMHYYDTAFAINPLQPTLESRTDTPVLVFPTSLLSQGDVLGVACTYVPEEFGERCESQPLIGQNMGRSGGPDFKTQIAPKLLSVYARLDRKGLGSLNLLKQYQSLFGSSRTVPPSFEEVLQLLPSEFHQELSHLRDQENPATPNF